MKFTIIYLLCFTIQYCNTLLCDSCILQCCDKGICNEQDCQCRAKKCDGNCCQFERCSNDDECSENKSTDIKSIVLIVLLSFFGFCFILTICIIKCRKKKLSIQRVAQVNIETEDMINLKKKKNIAIIPLQNIVLESPLTTIKMNKESKNIKDKDKNIIIENNELTLDGSPEAINQIYSNKELKF